MIPVRYDPAAELELLSQIQYLESRRVGLGRRFFSEVKESEALIAQFPDSSVEVGPGVRKRVLPNFQYSIFYRRKPGYWMLSVPGEQR